MAYTLTGKLIEKYRLSHNLPRTKLATMIGVEYRGLIDKLEDGSRKAPPEIALKLIKFLGIPTDEYVEALMRDYKSAICEELELLPKNVIESSAKKVEEEDDSWEKLI